MAFYVSDSAQPPPAERHGLGWGRVYSWPSISFPLISLLGVHASFMLRAGKIKQKALSYCRAWETRQGISQP